MKRSTRNIFACILVILLSALLLVSCKGIGTKKVLEDTEIPRVEGEFVSVRDYIVPEVTLDGVMDEEEWQNASEQSYGEIGTAPTNVKVFAGEAGIYIGAEIEDDELIARYSRTTYNSCFTVVLFASGTTTYATDEQAIAINIDADGNILMKRGKDSGKWGDIELGKLTTYPGDDIPTYFEYGVAVDGKVDDDKKDEGYSVELLINYNMLELIGGTDKQDYGMYFETVYFAGEARKLVRSDICGLYQDNGKLEKRRKINYATYSIDGLDNDAIWKKRNKYEYETNSNYTVSNYIAKEGLYLYFEVKDDKVCADGNSISQNDSLEIYLDVKNNGGKTPQEDDVQIRTDVTGGVQVMFGNGKIWKGSSTYDDIISVTRIINGKLNGAAEGYALEMFIPWKDLNVTSQPSDMKVYFGARDWDGIVKEDGSRTRPWYGTGKSASIPNDWMLMTKDFIKGRVPVSEIVLDGIVDDDLWKNANAHLAFGGTVRVLWTWTDFGCYFAMDVTDDNVVTESKRATQNSSIEIYLDYKGDGRTLSDDNRAITVDALGNLIVKTGANGKSYQDSSALVKRGATLTKTGYAVEIYVPWEEFLGEKPSNMRIAFGNRVFLAGKKSSNWLNDGYCKDVKQPDMYAVFTETSIEQ